MAWRKVTCRKGHERLAYSDLPRKGKVDRECPKCAWEAHFSTYPRPNLMAREPVLVGTPAYRKYR